MGLFSAPKSGLCLYCRRHSNELRSDGTCSKRCSKLADREASEEAASWDDDSQKRRWWN